MFQFSPILKKKLNGENPHEYIKVHILNDLVEKVMTEKSVDNNLDISYHSVNIEKVKNLLEDK